MKGNIFSSLSARRRNARAMKILYRLILFEISWIQKLILVQGQPR